MLQIQTNRGGETICDICKEEIAYKEDYYYDTKTGKIICETCACSGK